MRTLESIMSADMDDEVDDRNIILCDVNQVAQVTIIRPSGEKETMSLPAGKDVVVNLGDHRSFKFVGGISKVKRCTAKPMFMEDTFSHCVLKKADLTGLDLSECQKFTRMFLGCPVKRVDMTGLDVRNVSTTKEMFRGTTIRDTDDIKGFDKLNFTKLYSIEEMFCSCTELRRASFPTLFTKVRPHTSCVCLFADCTQLETAYLPGIGTVGGSLYGLFQGCKNLRYATITGSNRDKDFIITRIFEDCPKLERVECSQRTYNHIKKGMSGLSEDQMKKIKWVIV